MCTKNTRVTLC